MGNLASLQNALESINVDSKIISAPIELNSQDKLILPGVGAFGYAIKQLEISGLNEFIIKAALAQIKILGVCLGMQLLFDSSSEFGLHSGLKLLPGKVLSLNLAASNVKIPKIGWYAFSDLKTHVLTTDLVKESFFYYLHSFFCPVDPKFTIASSDYGLEHSVISVYNNIAGVQFHPEKSGNAGLILLRNFSAW